MTNSNIPLFLYTLYTTDTYLIYCQTFIRQVDVDVVVFYGI